MSDMHTELDRALRGDHIAELAAANHAAMTAHKAAKSYSDATAAAWYVTQSALAAALIEHQGDKS